MKPGSTEKIHSDSDSECNCPAAAAGQCFSKLTKINLERCNYHLLLALVCRSGLEYVRLVNEPEFERYTWKIMSDWMGKNHVSM